MAAKNKSGILFYLFLFITGVMIIPLVQSCGKDGAIGGSGNNARLQIVSISNDVLPFNLYARYIRQTPVYTYPNPSGYFLINAADTPLQIRTAQTSNNINVVNLLTLKQTLTRGVPYTMFVMGLRADSSLQAVVTADTSAVPANGRGKIRLVNGMGNIPAGIDLVLNGTTAFKKQLYTTVSNWVEVTAGTYNINVVANNAPTTVIKSLPNFTILDGKLYTIFTYGRSTGSDSTAYGVNALLNTLPPNTTY